MFSFGRRQRTGQRRIGVSVNQDRDGSFYLEYRLQRFQHPAGHGAVATAMDSEIVRRLPHAKLLKEDARHLRIEMLSGMNDNLVQVRVIGQCTTDRSRLDELRAGTQNGDDLRAAHRVDWHD